MNCSRTLKYMLIPLLILAFFTLALAQGPPPAPLEVTIAFTGQSSGDQTSTSPLGPLSLRRGEDTEYQG